MKKEPSIESKALLSEAHLDSDARLIAADLIQEESGNLQSASL